jgi:hypothetical protein
MWAVLGLVGRWHIAMHRFGLRRRKYEAAELAGRSVSLDSPLRNRIFAATHCLADLEAFELRMVKVERLVLARVPMAKTECFRLGPSLERRLALPYLERVVLVLGSLEQMELDETGDLGQLGVASQPHLLEGLFGASLHAESVHGNEHHPSPGPGQSVAVIGGVPATQVIAS